MFSKELDINSVSFPLGILTVLVTLLVGWQIYTHLYQDEKVQKIVDAKVQKAKAELYKEIQYNKSNLIFITFGNAVQSYFNALASWDEKMKNDETSQDGYNIIISHLKQIEKTIEKDEANISVDNKDTALFFIETALKTGDADIIKLANRFLENK